jgi:hypothetical protein
MGMHLPLQLNVFTAEEMCSSKPGQQNLEQECSLRKSRDGKGVDLTSLYHMTVHSHNHMFLLITTIAHPL